MQRELLAAFGGCCGRSSTSWHTDLPSNHASSFPPSSGNTCMAPPGEPRKGRVPHIAGSAFSICLLSFVVSLSFTEVPLVTIASQPWSAPPKANLALSLARERSARLVNFQHSRYGADSGNYMKFSRAALRNLAGELFPNNADALRKQKFLELASRFDLTNQVLDLTPAYRVQQVRSELEKATKKFGRAAKELPNPLNFSNAVRAAFHSFVNKLQREAMAQLHMENPALASRLEGVDVTTELRHLVASVLPAVQPSKPTANEKLALNGIMDFYGDLGATKQRVLAEAMEKVDTVTPVVTSSIEIKDAADKPTQAQMEAAISEIQAEARQRSSDAYQKMSPAEKLDFAAAGITSAQLTDAVFLKLVENKVSASPEEFKDKSMLQRVLAKFTPKSQIKDAGMATRNYAKHLTVLVLVSIMTATAAYVGRLKYKSARRRRAAKDKRPNVEEVSLTLDLDELATMPLEALKKKAYARSSSRRLR